MSVLAWGKPAIEVCKNENGAVPVGAIWKMFPAVKENTAKLNAAKGKKDEAIAEGGEVIDTRYGKNKYTFECDVFVKKDDVRPVEDNDGVIVDSYAIRLTPEDESLEGFMLENTSVSCEESWTSAEGKMLKYTFEGLKPANGKICKPYTKA